MMKPPVVETRMGTWGMVLKANARFNVTFMQPFHLKMAVLDFNGFAKQNFHFRVMLQDNNDDKQVPITVCMLSIEKSFQTPLDLQFESGDEVTFFIKTDVFNIDVNSFSVHLSGVSTRDLDVFIKEPVALRKIEEKKSNIAEKNRSISLPDEASNKKGVTAPQPTKTISSSEVKEGLASQSRKLVLSESSAHDEVPSPATIESSNSISRKNHERWSKTKLRAGTEKLGKLGKFLTK